MLNYTNLTNLYYDADAALLAGIRANSFILMRAALLRGANATKALPHALDNVDAARILIEQGKADVNAIHFAHRTLNDNFKTGATVTHMAAEQGLADTLNLLLSFGAIPNLGTYTRRVHVENDVPVPYFGVKRAHFFGDTPLHYAAAANHVEIARRLLADQRVQVDTRNRNKETALHSAARQGDVEMATLLLKAHANPVVLNVCAQMPLQVALNHKKSNMVEFLSEITLRNQLIAQGEPLPYYRSVFQRVDAQAVAATPTRKAIVWREDVASRSKRANDDQQASSKKRKPN